MAEGNVLGRGACKPVFDRSRVRILLFDKDPTNSQEVVILLRRCCYQVTAVKTARQVMEVLSSCGSQVDLILAEIELPKEKGFKLLKHVVRHDLLKRIPIVMMSARDEMAVVVKCLRLGAVDYLVKPLRTNELLNLWTHTWRRRRLLGMAEKRLILGGFSNPFDLLISDAGEPNNTNDTNIFSEDTDDITCSTSMHSECDFASCELSEISPGLELSLRPSSDFTEIAVSECCTTAGLMPSAPRKSKLTFGKSSAFLAYTKVCNNVSTGSGNAHSTCVEGILDIPKERMVHEYSSILPQLPTDVGVSSSESNTGQPAVNWNATKASSRSENEPWDVDNNMNSSSIPIPNPHEPGGKVSYRVQLPQLHTREGRRRQQDIAAVSSLPAPFVTGGMMHQTGDSPASMPQSTQFYYGLPQNDAIASTSSQPVLNTLPFGHTFPLNTSFSYFPLGLHAASPQFVPCTGWPAMPAASIVEQKLGQAERRELAVNKFRLKRKDRCFEKKIRYVSRKKLADQRPRIKGQFVRTNYEQMTEKDVMNEYNDDEEDVNPGSSMCIGRMFLAGNLNQIAHKSHCTSL